MKTALQPTENGFVITAELDCSVSQARCLAMVCASWVREAVGGEAKILWPNHVVLGERRVCAVTCRATGDRDIMLTFKPDHEALDIAPEDLAERVASAAQRDLAAYPDNRSELIQTYCRHCRTVMQYVNVTYRGVPLFGFAFAVDRHGGLMVMTQNSRTVVTLYGGEAKIAGKDDAPVEIPDLPPMPGG